MEPYRAGYEAGYLAGMAAGKKHVAEESIMKLKDSAKRGCLDGRQVGGKLYGYTIRHEGSKKYVSICEQESLIVVEAFSKYSQGWSATDIAKDLNGRKIPSPRGGQWSTLNFVNGNRGMFCNVKYLGYFTYADTHLTGEPWAGYFPNLALVSLETWCAVQRVQHARAVMRANMKRRVLRREDVARQANNRVGPKSLNWEKLYPKLVPWKYFRITTNQQEEKRSCREMRKIIEKINKELSPSRDVLPSSDEKVESVIASNLSGDSHYSSEILSPEEYLTNRQTPYLQQGQSY